VGVLVNWWGTVVIGIVMVVVNCGGDEYSDYCGEGIEVDAWGWQGGVQYVFWGWAG